MIEKRSNLVLTQALLVSGALNVAFIGAFFFIMVQEAPLYFTMREVKSSSTQARHHDSTASQLLSQLQTLPMEDLIKHLEDNSMVEDGFQSRDFALSLLVQKYHFDLNRAILGLDAPKHKKSLKIASNETIHLLDLYTDLTDSHYKSILEFAKVEKWPLTTDGLFLALKNSPHDPSLKQTFMQTPLFTNLQSHSDETPENILTIILAQDTLAACPKFKKAPPICPCPPPKSTATTTTPSPQVIATSPQPKTHIVQEGESLWRISRHHKVDIAALKSLNHLHSDSIRPGQTLLLP